MKALGKAKAEPGIHMLDWPEPECGPNDVLIRIRKTAICGTDAHIWKWDDWAQKTIPVPMHVGHEYVGEIVEMGVEVRGFSVGDRVSGEGHITCGFCRNCRAGRRHLCRNTVGVGVNREGAFAEYLVIPAFNAFRIPDDISDDLASIFARSEDTHAKAWFPTGAIDGEDFGECLAAAKRTGYSGPYTLIYEDKGADEWTAVEIERDFVKGYFNGGHA